jgi:hypothetical protein
MSSPTPGLLRDRIWVRASEWARDNFTCDAHKPDGDRCHDAVAAGHLALSSNVVRMARLAA